jgi:hypothetical protein
MLKRIMIAVPVLAVAAALGGAAIASASPSAPAGMTASASTVLSNRPDGGNHDNATPGPKPNQTWANDNFTRTASVTLVGTVSLSNCPVSSTGYCYEWTGKIADKGTFTVNPTFFSHSKSPGAQDQTLHAFVKGAFSGGSADITFYSDQKTANPALAPPKINNNGQDPSGRGTTTNWVEQFFGPSAHFNSVANPGGPDLGNWSWTYTANFGSNKACPNDAYQWIDAASNQDGAVKADGDILAPDQAHCT